jgi:hypothetical protein
MSKKQAPAAPQPKEKRINLRIDAELFDAATDQAVPQGGISVVIRALLRKYVSGAVTITDSEALSEIVPAKRSD